MRSRARAAAAMAAGILAGCGGGGGGDDQPPDDGLTSITTIPVTLNRALDVLFVIDNSGSMAEEQAAFTRDFPVLVSGTSLIPGGLPDVHFGVVSTNVGTGGVNIGGCSSAARPEGDDGNLLTNACAGLTGQFISNVKQPDGSRVTNYSGDLATLFTCMAQLGTTGCGFEQPLEAMKRALSPGKNPGFLREDARLAVVILADEDDCSAQPGGALFGDPNGTIASPLGPRTSFRCFEFGVRCDDDSNPRMFGARTGCVPRDGSPYMQDVEPYAAFARSLKVSPRDVIVAGIFGDVDAERSATVGPDPDDATRPAVGPGCTSASGVAFPGHRLQSFVESFTHHTFTASVCRDNYAEAFDGLAATLRDAIGDPCIDVPLVDDVPETPGLQPRCRILEFQDVGGVRGTDTELPSCDTAAAPCWRLTPDALRCPLTFDNLAIEIDRGGAQPPLGTYVEVRCLVEA